jgi:3-methylcrotonyl-CoA carboxylase alpha subunit
LPKRQEELSINGHAIEARLYAEDPAKGFLPSTGRLEYFSLPKAVRQTLWQAVPSGRALETEYEQSVRIETGVEEGDSISPFYDPMIAKLICHAENRQEAIISLAKICGDSGVWPVKTNASFLHSLLVNPDFCRARLDTGFIASHEVDLALDEYDAPQWLLDTAALYLTAPRTALSGFRLNAAVNPEVRLSVNGQAQVAKFLPEPRYEQQQHCLYSKVGDQIFAVDLGATYRIVRERHDGTGQASAADGAIIAPMPGKVIAVAVSEGQTVTAGQRLMVLEAMKMEHALTAPFDGVIEGLSVSAGGQVQVEALLCRVVPAGA